MDYNSDASDVANDRNVIENDKKILKSPNSEYDVLGGSLKSFDYYPQEISIGDTITIDYETSKLLSGTINIELGDYSQVYENCPSYGDVSFTYEGTQMGKLEGTFIFTDTAGEPSKKTFQVTVTGKPVPEITVTNSTLNLKVNDEVATGATLKPAEAGNLTYTSSNPSVAIVENGKIKALANGTAIITVSFAGNENYPAAENKTITVNVCLDASVSVNNSTLNLLIGDTFTLVATTNPEGLDVNFVPDESGVYSIDENGVITALKKVLDQ